MGAFRDTIADLLRTAVEDSTDLDSDIADIYLAVQDAVGHDEFAKAAPVGTVLITVEGGIAEATHVPAGVHVRIVDIDTDTTEPDEVVHDVTHEGPVGSSWALMAADDRIASLTGTVKA